MRNWFISTAVRSVPDTKSRLCVEYVKHSRQDGCSNLTISLVKVVAEGPESCRV